jgi:hypothetical protein
VRHTCELTDNTVILCIYRNRLSMLSDMVQGSDSKAGMITAARRLFRGGRRAFGDIIATLTADRITRIRRESK